MPTRRFLLAGLLAFSSTLSLAVSAEPEATKPERKAAGKPIAVVAVASIDRLVGAIGTVFKAGEREDLNRQLDGFLVNLGNFEGFDRQRPAGVMVFLGAGLPPQPEPIGFLPVKDVERFVRTFAFAQIRMQPLEGQAGRYELVGPDGKLQVRIAEGWAWIGKTPASVEQSFVDPSEMTRGFLEPYDLAATVDLTAIPPGLKVLGVGAFRAQVESNLQKQKGPDDERQLHRAVAEELLETLDYLAKDGERAVVGLAVSADKPAARIEARLVCRNDPGAKEAETLRPIVAERFRTSLDPAAAARLSLSARLSDRQRTIVRDAVQIARRKAISGDFPADAALPRLFECLAATAEAGRLELLTQFAGSPPGPFVLVGGIGVAKSDLLAGALPGLLEEAKRAPNVAEVKTGVATQADVVLHRLVGEQSSPDLERLYGEKPALFVGAGKETFWFAAGGRDGAETLGRFITASTARPANGAADPALAPPEPGGIELAIQAGAWVGLQGERGDARNVELLRSAFSQGHDGLRLHYRNAPGPKLQLDFESGWLRLLGLGAGRAVDERNAR